MWQSRSVITAFVFLFGLAVGSFLNVCILRIPAEESIVHPASHCPACSTPIRAYDNIPVLSWLLLGGKCRHCKAKISLLYPTIELLTALLFVACYHVFGLTPAGLKWTFFICLIVVLTVTDLRVRLLPDAVTWPGFGMGLGLSVGSPSGDGAGRWLAERFLHMQPSFRILGLVDGLLGAATGSLFLWLVSKAYLLWRGREGMGLGDVKMMAMAGAFLGLRNTFLTILFATALGSVAGIAILAVLYATGWKRNVAERASRRGLGSVAGLRYVLASQYQLPFGTFLGAAALLVVFLTNATAGVNGLSFAAR